MSFARSVGRHSHESGSQGGELEAAALPDHASRHEPGGGDQLTLFDGVTALTDNTTEAGSADDTLDAYTGYVGRNGSTVDGLYGNQERDVIDNNRARLDRMETVVDELKQNLADAVAKINELRSASA